ncbi:MAG: MBL fold metallo-hydrolase [Gammaproteobacteria bacterium]
MRFATLGSGSSGNATLIEHDGAALLIDCGLSVREAARRAAELGVELEQVEAILVTHEHDDHVSGAAALARRYGAAVFASAGTCLGSNGRLDGIGSLACVRPETAFAIGPFTVRPTIVPHDAREPCQFVVEAGGLRLGVLTDLGQLTAHLLRHFAALDGLVLEFNHEPGLLGDSVYPAALKRRIGGNYGHLSNQQAASFLEQVDTTRLQGFVAAHLSEKTNTPAHVAAELDRCLPATVPRQIASQHAPTAWTTLAVSAS